MATGIQTTLSKRITTIRLVESATSANGAPSGVPLSVPTAGRGFDLNSLSPGLSWQGDCTVRIFETAGSGTMTCASARVWGYSRSSEKWTPLGVGTATSKGLLNGGSSFTETGSDQLRHAEPLLFPQHLDGIYIELGAIAGTDTALTVEIDLTKHNAARA